MLKKKQEKNSSGKACIQDNKIYWDFNAKNLLLLNIEDIVIIGEYTNNNGPWLNDWFISFITENNNWYGIPGYAGNIDLEFWGSWCGYCKKQPSYTGYPIIPLIS